MPEIGAFEAKTHLPRLLQRVQAVNDSSSPSTIARWQN